MTELAAADPDFRRIPDLIREHAQARPTRAALVQADTQSPTNEDETKWHEMWQLSRNDHRCIKDKPRAS